jgi:hypothetical protein
LSVLHIKDHKKEQAKKALQKALELKKEYLDVSYNLSSLINDETLFPKFTLKELRAYLIPYCS